MAEKSKIIQSLVMTGISCDGIDMALIRTDGVHDISPLQFESSPFTPSLAHHLIALGQKHAKLASLFLMTLQQMQSSLPIAMKLPMPLS